MTQKILQLGLLTISLFLAACGPGQSPAGQSGVGADEGAELPPFVIGAIPDQDPEKLQRRYSLLADYLAQELRVPVEYKPVTDYAASVTAFRVGDLDMVWFGGLTGVQARLQVDQAQALVQRASDEQFHSVFIAGKDSGLEPVAVQEDLAQLKGRTFTFGSQSSTSGRLMPQYFLGQAGVELADFKGSPGFSGSHDATIELVTAGSFEAGALNEQVWNSRVEAGQVDLDKVQLIWRTPPYHDYHWVIRSEVKERYGDDFLAQVSQAFLQLDAADPEHKAILELFDAAQFIPTNNDNYAQIEAIGRQIGQIE